MKNNSLVCREVKVAHNQHQALGRGTKRSGAGSEDHPHDLAHLLTLQIMVVYIEDLHADRPALDGDMQNSTRHKSHRVASHAFSSYLTKLRKKNCNPPANPLRIRVPA